MNKEEIIKLMKPFCADSDRPTLMEIFYSDGYAVATDGHMMVRAKGIEVPVIPNTPDINKVLKGIDFDVEYESLPVKDIEELGEECSDCEGKGEVFKQKIECYCDDDGDVEFEDEGGHYYCCECKNCEGKGYTLEESKTPMTCNACSGTKMSNDVFLFNGKKRYNSNYLIRIARLPGFKFPLDIGEALAATPFKWEYGDGIIMPMRRIDT